MSIFGKIIAIILFLGGVSTFVAYRMGAFEPAEIPNNSSVKDPIVRDDYAEPLADTSKTLEKVTPEISIIESDSERMIRIMSSSKSIQVVEPISWGKTTPSDEVTSEFLKKRAPKMKIIPGSKSGPVFELGDFTPEKKSLHPYLDSVTKSDSIKKTTMMGGSKSIILSSPLELKSDKKK